VITPNNLPQIVAKFLQQQVVSEKYLIIGSLKTISLVLLRFKCNLFATAQDFICGWTQSPVSVLRRKKCSVISIFE